MALVRNRALVTDDPWTIVPDDQPIPDSGDVVVGLARLTDEAAALAGRSGRVGVRLDPTDDVTTLADRVGSLELIVVSFPKFVDGRGYSQARLLRDRYAYRGELRAVGDVLADQLFLMQRCGIDSFELKDGKDVEVSIACMDDLQVTYQGASDDPRPLFRRTTRTADAS